MRNTAKMILTTIPAKTIISNNFVFFVIFLALFHQNRTDHKHTPYELSRTRAGHLYA